MATSAIDLVKLNAEIDESNRSICRDSFEEFVKLCWHIVNPAEPLVWTWTMGAIVEHLDAVTRGQIRRLLINVPPGFSKSMLVNVLWPAWEWIKRPELRYVSWAYAEALTIRDNRRTRFIIENELYQRLWGQCVTCRSRSENEPRCEACEKGKRFRLAGDQNAKVRYDNDFLGFRIATSTTGMGTGERPHRNIIDDPHNVKGAESEARRESTIEWLAHTLPTRTIDALTTAFVYIMQRIHENDVAGHLLEHGLVDDVLLVEMRYQGDEHIVRKKFSLPPTTSIGWSDRRKVIGELACPERFPLKVVEDLEKSLRSFGGDYAVAGQLEQAPVGKSGGMFEESWFGKIIELDELPFGKDGRGWDFAGSTRKRSPYTAGVKGRLVNGTLYLVDVVCERWDAADLENKVVAVAKDDGYQTWQDVPQDPGQAGKAQVASLGKRLHGYTVFASPESGEKSVRAQPVASQAKLGNVVLVAGKWNAGFVAEAKMFPRGMFKDRIDALSRLYAGLVSLHGDDAPVSGHVVGSSREDSADRYAGELSLVSGHGRPRF